MPEINPEYTASASNPEDLEEQVGGVNANKKRLEEFLEDAKKSTDKKIEQQAEKLYQEAIELDEKIIELNEKRENIERKIESLEKMLSV